jgi:hypothetical protein
MRFICCSSRRRATFCQPPPTSSRPSKGQRSLLVFTNGKHHLWRFDSC